MALRHELHAGLAISAMHNAAAPAEDQREFARKTVPLIDDELGAARGNLADDAIELRPDAIRLHMSQVVDVVTRALAEIRALVALCTLAAHRTLVELTESPLLPE